MKLIVIFLIFFILLYQPSRYYYFDSNGTLPMYKSVASSYPSLLNYGNASSEYSQGKNIIARTSDYIKNYLSLPNHHVIFNSGASEGNNAVFISLAIYYKNPHYIISSIEHKTSLNCVKHLKKANLIDATFINPRQNGGIHPDDIVKEIRPNTKLISVMWVNNETGHINNIDAIANLCKQYNIFYHCDIVQAFGKFKKDLHKIDALTISFHKLHGPIGVGCLLLSEKLGTILQKHPHIAGAQFNSMRGGTENIAGICASYLSMRITHKDRAKKNIKLAKKKNYFLRSLNLPIVYFEDLANSNLTTPIICVLYTKKSAPNTLLLSLFYPNLPKKYKFCNISFKKYLFKHNIIISIGSTCNTKSKKPSHVLLGMGVPYILRAGTCRFTFNDFTTYSNIDFLIKHIHRYLANDLLNKIDQNNIHKNGTRLSKPFTKHYRR